MHLTKARRFVVLLAAGWVSGAAELAQAQDFEDDFESGLGLWTATDGWGATTASAHSPTHAATDSPGAYHANTL